MTKSLKGCYCIEFWDALLCNLELKIFLKGELILITASMRELVFNYFRLAIERIEGDRLCPIRFCYPNGVRRQKVARTVIFGLVLTLIVSVGAASDVAQHSKQIEDVSEVDIQVVQVMNIGVSRVELGASFDDDRFQHAAHLVAQVLLSRSRVLIRNSSCSATPRTVTIGRQF